MDRQKVLDHLWTARWNLNKSIDTIERAAEVQYPAVKETMEDALRSFQKGLHEAQTSQPPVSVPIPQKPVPEPPKTPETPKPGLGAKYIPFAIQSPTKMKGRGAYPGGYPRGAVVHFTAGRNKKGLSDAQNTINDGVKSGYAYLCIASDGQVIQAHPVDQWGYHAGESAWNRPLFKLVGSVSDDLIGIEICNAGLLTKQADGSFKSWFGEIYAPADVRYVTEAEWGCPTGYYQKYTQAQEEALIKVLLWLKQNDPTGKTFSFDYILGHHEVAGKLGIGYWRKNDPGGALSMPMDKFRTLLKSKV